MSTSFAVLPALIPDIKPVYDAYFAAFTTDADGRKILEILFPGGYTSEEFRKAHTEGTVAWLHKAESQYTWKCVDIATGEIVGMALCDVFIKPRTKEERAYPGIPWLEGEQRERADNVLKPLCEAREKIMGNGSYIYVHAIAVDPKHQGRGAGAMIVKELINLSNDSNLPIYLESSASAEGLYKKMGFVRVPEESARVVHSKSVLGTETDVEVPLMIKTPAKTRL
ncbi:hypothetical protein SMACR_09349 [Sordaria macrospora]|uniref:WGS project CABT00000000 data, contig 2.86 n=2 Tax=Sordaria macrospora TaxID=5147 RepID=F7WBV9_SORMK|nr:uncharacterized protein SMAC_09349 [Sordaria macrospora k-hell]KAA8629395.1 hypothetical protein SMACR_09349 [Sordaria macrospora]KAH7625164.1 hypothetical protein B0T09DRAFT_315824 [Sordaria sp. MPI-SDFR-AT-0083]WPJ65066.1 hypothetical protein SMAC4_09349 [Sordaria macrospora]CCC05503.1 unnamed protein product [Sordaria macrospora k-hell]